MPDMRDRTEKKKEEAHIRHSHLHLDRVRVVVRRKLRVARGRFPSALVAHPLVVGLPTRHAGARVPRRRVRRRPSMLSTRA